MEVYHVQGSGSGQFTVSIEVPYDEKITPLCSFAIQEISTSY